MAKEVDNLKNNSFGIIAFILGILSLLFSFGVLLGFIAGIILGVLGVIFSIVQFRKERNSLATWGLILSLAGIVLNILVAIWFMNILTQTLQQVQQLQSAGVDISNLQQLQQIQNVPN